MKKSNKKKPTWTDLKRQLADLDRPALLALIQDLYATSKNNQAISPCPLRPGRGCARTVQGHHRPLGLPGRHAQSGDFGRQGQEGYFRLQESHRTAGRFGGADSVLLRILHEPARLLRDG